MGTVFAWTSLRSPARIALFYATFGFLWIAFSDALLARLVMDLDTMTRISMYKGGFFIVLTSTLVFLLARNQVVHQKRIEQQLREREQELKETSRELQMILDHIPALILYKNDKNVILRVNKATAEAAGTDAETMAGKPAKLFYPEYADKYYQDDLEVIRTGLPQLGVVEETPAPDGGTNWIETDKIPIRTQEGIVSEILIVASDITRRKQAEEALEEQRALFEAIFNDIPDALMFADLDRRIIMANPGANRIFGYQSSEIIGESTLILYADKQEYEHQGKLRFNQNADEILKPYTVHYRRKNGEVFPGESIGTVINDPEGQLVGYLGVIRDISDRMETEQETRELRERLAHVARVSLMGEMAAGIAHEINQPLTAIANYSQACRRLLETNPGSPKLATALSQISEQALRAGDVIHKLRSFVKQGETERKPVDCNSLIQDVVKFSEMETRFNTIPIRLELAKDLPPISVDPVQIQQVLLNLVRNGMDASIAAQLPEPEIRIRSRLENGDHVLVSVEDNGTGVPEDVIQEIFSPFFTTKSSGLGMGLSICRTIIKSHAGELNFKPGPSGGSCFYFTLPVIGE